MIFIVVVAGDLVVESFITLVAIKLQTSATEALTDF